MSFIALAAELLPLLIKAGMDITPTIEHLISVNKDNITDADWDFLRSQRAAALAVINDKSRDA